MTSDLQMAALRFYHAATRERPQGPSRGLAQRSDLWYIDAPPSQKEQSLMTTDHQKVEELRLSAQQLAKQALETAELGLRLARTQFETVVRPGASGAAGAASASAADISRNLQDVTLNAETKAKEMFTLATNFMAELNDKWQPGTARPATDAAAEKARPEKINIDVE
jgi:hypothetical protein